MTILYNSDQSKIRKTLYNKTIPLLSKIDDTISLTVFNKSK